MKLKLPAEQLPLILFLTGAISTVVLLLLFAYAPDLRDGGSSGADAVSRSAVGFAGLDRLLQLSGISTQIDRGAVAGENAHPSLTILTPPITATTQDWRDYQEQGAVLIILPKWITVPLPIRQDWVMKMGVWPRSAIARLIGPVTSLQVMQMPGDWKNIALRTQTPLAGLPARLGRSIEELQSVQGGTALLRISGTLGSRRQPSADMPVLVRIRGGAKPIYVLSEPDLMNNHGLSDDAVAQTALAIVRSLRQGGGPVRLDVTLNGMVRTPNLLKALFQPPFRGATICALLAALLMALHTLTRFGAPLRRGRVFARGKAALVDNSAQLIRMMGRESAMARRYLQASREMVMTRSGTRRRSGAQQDALLAALERSAGCETSYAQLAAQAADAQTSADLMRVAARTYAWRGKLSGEH